MRAFLTLAIISTTIVIGGVAHATSSCGSTQVKTSNYTLTDDWDAGSVPCFELRNGANLNLNGYQIFSGSDVAVLCTNNGSTVHSSVNTDDDHVDIDGAFTVGAKNCTVVKNLVIDGAATAISSMSNANQIFGNKLVRDFATGIEHTGSTHCRLEDNLLLEGTTPISVNTNWTRTNNVCEADADCACDIGDVYDARYCLF